MWKVIVVESCMNYNTAAKKRIERKQLNHTTTFTDTVLMAASWIPTLQSLRTRRDPYRRHASDLCAV